MTRVIMTEVKSPYGKYTAFNVNGTGQLIGEVDRRGRYYVVFCNGHQQGQRSNKDAAIQYAQKCITAVLPNPVEFKWNVMAYKEKA